MWWRLSSGACLEDNDAISLNIRPQAPALNRLGEDFGGPTERLPNTPFKSNKPNKIHLGRRVEFGQQIHITIRLSAATRDGAEQRQMADTSAAQLRLVRPQGGDYMLGEIDRGRCTHPGVSKL
jgi:hypothetical protein